jgi:hypothetical protein
MTALSALPRVEVTADVPRFPGQDALDDFVDRVERRVQQYLSVL